MLTVRFFNAYKVGLGDCISGGAYDSTGYDATEYAAGWDAGLDILLTDAENRAKGVEAPFYSYSD